MSSRQSARFEKLRLGPQQSKLDTSTTTFAEDRKLITNEVVGRMSLTNLVLLDGGEIG